MSGHHHDHDGHCHGEDHDHTNDITPAIQSLLYSQINFDLITTLNGTHDHCDHQATIADDFLNLDRDNPKLWYSHRPENLGRATKRQARARK